MFALRVLAAARGVQHVRRLRRAVLGLREPPAGLVADRPLGRAARPAGLQQADVRGHRAAACGRFPAAPAVEDRRGLDRRLHRHPGTAGGNVAGHDRPAPALPRVRRAGSGARMRAGRLAAGDSRGSADRGGAKRRRARSGRGLDDHERDPGVADRQRLHVAVPHPAPVGGGGGRERRLLPGRPARRPAALPPLHRHRPRPVPARRSPRPGPLAAAPVPGRDRRLLPAVHRLELAGRRRLHRQSLLRQRHPGLPVPGSGPDPALDGPGRLHRGRPFRRRDGAGTLRRHRPLADAAGAHAERPAPLPAVRVLAPQSARLRTQGRRRDGGPGSRGPGAGAGRPLVGRRARAERALPRITAPVRRPGALRLLARGGEPRPSEAGRRPAGRRRVRGSRPTATGRPALPQAPQDEATRRGAELRPPRTHRDHARRADEVDQGAAAGTVLRVRMEPGDRGDLLPRRGAAHPGQ